MSNFPSRNGLRLCSHKDPQGEAQKWVQSLGVQADRHYLVLGVGAGFHLDELALQVKPSNFLAFDFDLPSETLELAPERKWLSQIQILDPTSDFRNVLKALPVMGSQFIQIAPFRPAWIGYQLEFERLKMVLRGARQFDPQILAPNHIMADQIYLALKELVV